MKHILALLPQIKALWADEKRRTGLLVVLGAAGMLLLALSEWLPAETEPPPETEAAVEQLPAGYAAELEDRLAGLLAQVEGAGQVTVMVTLQGGEETFYAKNTDTAADGAVHEEPVLVGGSGGPALIERVSVPALQGVAVVCEGGGSAAVQSRVTDIVAALTGLGTSHITVTPMVTAQYREG